MVILVGPVLHPLTKSETIHKNTMTDGKTNTLETLMIVIMATHQASIPVVEEQAIGSPD